MSAKPSHNLAGLQVAHPRATSPAVCLLKELGFHVDNKRLSLISLAALKLPTRGWGVSGEPDPLSAGRKPKGNSLQCSCWNDSISLLSFLLGTLAQSS